MKTCFKCNRSLLRSEFYAHPRMEDGLLGKCKDCTKADTNARIAQVQQNPEWLAGERARCRAKQEAYRKAAANAVRCGKLVPMANCEDCGKETKLQKHHADYSKPLSVEWLCTKCHGIRHHKS